MKELQIGNPYPLSQILNIYVESEAMAFEMENAIHKHLRNFQMEGEWFRAAPVMQLIDQEIVKIGKFQFGGRAVPADNVCAVLCISSLP